MLDLNFIRSQFPAFSQPNLQGWAFFENAGGSYACQQVIDHLHRYYTETKLQPYGVYPASARAGKEMDSSYERLAGYLNVTADEVHLGPSTSQNTYVLAQAFRAGWKEGDEIIVTNQDHEANSGVWRRLAETGIVVREWQIDPQTGELDLADLDALLSEKTKLLAFPHCSNVVAYMNPVAEISAKAHAVGAIVVTDGVAAAPHGFPDVDALGCDIYLFSLYKTFGPHQGLMVVRSRVLDKLANQSHYFNAESIHKKLVPAGPDHAQVAAAGSIASYFDAVYDHHFSEQADTAERGRRIHDLFRDHESALTQHLLDWLDNRSDVSVVGPTDAAVRAPTVAVTLQNKSASFVARELAEHKVMVSSGDFYAVRVLQGMNIPLKPGVLRMSFVHYTTLDEVNQVIDALDAVL